MERARRVLIGQFFYDVATSYRLPGHLPQCALYIWDRASQNRGELTTADAAAAFLLAQKWSDTTLFSTAEIARLFSVGETDVRSTEAALFHVFLSVKVLRADRALTHYLRGCNRDAQRQASAFFNMSLLGSCPPTPHIAARPFI